MNDKYLLSELEDRIIDTVTNNAKDIKNYSILLSGGFDSGLLAAITKPSRAYRIKFSYNTRFDESRYAEAISKHLNLPINGIEVNEDNFKTYFEEAVKVNGEVTTHFSLVPLYILFKTLAERGEKDVLSGEGPDEYLGGYARYIIFDELKKLYEIPELRNYHGMISKIISFPNSRDTFIIKYVKFMGYSMNNILDYVQERDYPFLGIIGKLDMKLGTIEKMEQKFANHFGIKLHYPYINDELAEYCYKLPDRLKIRNEVTKWGFKQIAMKYLPEIMRDRNKMGGPVAPVNKLMGWDLDAFDKSKYISEQRKILNLE